MSLISCTKPPNTIKITETSFVVCPSRPINIQCEDYIRLEEGSTIRDMILAYRQNGLRHEQCSKTVELWKTAYERCAKAFKRQ